LPATFFALAASFFGAAFFTTGVTFAFAFGVDFAAFAFTAGLALPFAFGAGFAAAFAFAAAGFFAAPFGFAGAGAAAFAFTATFFAGGLAPPDRSPFALGAGLDGGGAGETPGTSIATLRALVSRPVVHHSTKDSESWNIAARAGSEARLYARFTISFAGKVRSRCVTTSTASAPATNSGR
jgi:hypothetical protein